MLSLQFKDNSVDIGDTVRIKSTIVEGGKTRAQTFKGLLIAISGRGENRTFKVRHIGPQGIGVERTWPLNAKSLVDVERVKPAKKVRRAKLYYLRDLTGKMATRV
ncbi:50S ribosomal protein L19 [Candidatus Daviesbacteria bacterium]|nr:50S ribosomal protein L19 [Candidatus Daviesbacteria bacterium]